MSGDVQGPVPRRGVWSALALSGLLVLSTAVSLWSQQPPSVLPEDAPAPAFSAERALAHVRAIAREPHPAGSEANRRVRDYIMEYTRARGLSPELQRAHLHWMPGHAATVENVVARMPGTEHSGQAVLLMAHYDSVAFGPGAADDGSGVAALLEAMRALAAEPAPRHDVIFLFTDGEESRIAGGAGCRGPIAFVEQHPRAADVRVVLNFDARGNTGPSYMYQTSPENGWLVRQVAAAGCTPVASSLMGAFFKSMPVDSDLTRFLDAGYAGFNFAFIAGLEKYHTALDTVENMNPASLQHHGNYALALARRLANGPLDTVTAPDRTYFNIAGYWLAHYPESRAMRLALLAVLAWAVAFVGARARGHASAAGVLAGFAGLGLALLLACGAAAGAMLTGYRARGIYLIYSSDVLTLAVVCLAVLVSLLTIRLLARRFTLCGVALGMLAWWCLAAVLLAAVLPGAAYLFTWPALAACLALAGFMLVDARLERPGWPAVFVLAAGAAPALLLWPGALLGFHACLTFIFGALTAGGIVLLCGLLAPQLAALAAPAPRLLMTALAVAVLGFTLAGVRWPGFSAEQPKFNSVSYALDTESGAALWISSDPEPDAWQTQFFSFDARHAPLPAFFPGAPGPYMQAAAPVIDAPPPVMEMVGETLNEGERALRFRVYSPRKAPVIVVYASGTPVLGGSVNGLPLLLDLGPWSLSYGICPAEGFELEVRVPTGAPAVFRVVDHSYGLPDFPPEALAPRPPEFIPKPNTPDFNREVLKTDEFLVSTVRTF